MPTRHPTPKFWVELTNVLANAGITEDGRPFNFLDAVTTEAEAQLTGLVVMSNTVDSDKVVQINPSDTRVIINNGRPNGRQVIVPKGQVSAFFTISFTGWFASQTDVKIIGTFDGFFPAPAKILTLTVLPSLH